MLKGVNLLSHVAHFCWSQDGMTGKDNKLNSLQSDVRHACCKHRTLTGVFANTRARLPRLLQSFTRLLQCFPCWSYAWPWPAAPVLGNLFQPVIELQGAARLLVTLFFVARPPWDALSETALRGGL